MLACKYEHLAFDVNGLPATLQSSGMSGANSVVGRYVQDVFELGANFWVTRHSRLMANYVLNYIGAGDSSQAAAALQKNLFFKKPEHELLFRLAVSL
jgi:hypothetical protein